MRDGRLSALTGGAGVPTIMAVEPTSVGDQAAPGREPAGGTSGAIVLARHGEPLLSRKIKLNAVEYAEWWGRYEVLGLRPDQVAPEPLTAFAADAGVVICSTRVRAIESAQVVCGQRVFEIDERLIEAPLPPPNWPDWLRMSPRFWGVIARTWWWFFDHHMGQETRAQADATLADAEPDPGTRKFLLSNLLLGGVPQWRVGLAHIAADMPDISDWPFADEAYPGPVLFVLGGQSRYVRPEHRPGILRHFPRARFVTIKNAGHWVHADDPEGVLAVLKAATRL